MLCPYCQANNPDTARFCFNCGHELIHKCSRCESELLPDALFCMQCGEPAQDQIPGNANRLIRLKPVPPRDLIQKMRPVSRLTENPYPGSLSEKRTVTVLMLDVVSSHELVRQLDFETWVELMSQAFDRIVPVVERFDGTISLVVDDALLAVFGAPIAHEDDPLRAVRAGLEIIPQIEKYSQEVKQAHGVDLRMWVGINTGPIVVSPVRDDLTADYSGFGKTVNLAASIKSAGSPMSVLVSENTYHFIAPFYDCHDLGSVEVSGWYEAVHVFRVQSTRISHRPTRGFTDLTSPMVGRDGELASLIEAYEAVRAGMGRAVIVMGEPGLGKTRLVQEWQNAAEIAVLETNPSSEKPTIRRWVSGRCISYGHGLAYQLVIDVVKNLIGVTETSDESEIHQALLSTISNLLANKMMEVYPFLGHLLSLKLEGEALLRSQINDPLARKTQYLLAIQQLFQALMKEKPLVLVLEDLHWADASSVELFRNLLPLVESEPFLLCLTTRPDQDTPGWRLVNAMHERLGKSLIEIDLYSLTEEESKRLVSNLLEIESLPARVRQVILSKAEGNPYFVEELIRMFIEQRVIFKKEGAWIAQGEVSEHDIPDNLQGLLLARIDRLPVEARHALLVASVIGRNFSLNVLSYVMQGSKTLNSDINQLESAGLIEMAKIVPELEYTFHHALVQDAANALLLKKDRKRLHQAVGEATENLYPDRKKELAAVLGYHFKEACLEQRALAYFMMAGDEALASNANQEAEIQFRYALELKCCSAVEIAKFNAGLGRALLRQDRLNESLQAFRSGIDIYKSLADSEGIAQLYHQVGRLEWVAGDRPESLRVCLEGLDLVKDAAESIGKATLIHETARSYYFNGVIDKGLQLCQQALEMAERLGAVNIQAEALVTLGLLYENLSVEECLKALHTALELAEANGLLDVAAEAHNDLGVEIQFWQVDFQTAMLHYIRAAEINRLRGIASSELAALLNYINCLFILGKRKEIEAEIPYLGELIAKTSNSAPMLMRIKAIQGRLIGYRGDWETSINILRECLQEYQKQKNLEQILGYVDEISIEMLERNRWGELPDISEVEYLLQQVLQIVDQNLTYGKINIYPRMSMLWARQGECKNARLWLEKTRQVSKIMPSSWDVLHQVQCEVEIAFAEQDWTKALAAIEKVAGEQHRIGLRVDWAASLLFWAVILLRRGEPADLEQAQILLDDALTAFNEMGVGRYPEIGEQLLKETRARLHDQTLNHTQMTRELKKARQVQETLLPEKVPEIPGWQLEVILKPAHETSGDFYDFLSLPDSNLGLVIADVTDKGTSAALYMALCRSLWRTFAMDHPDDPVRTLQETNQHILADTHGGLFITLIYGILDPRRGTFTYCSAGHHPALHLHAQDGSIEDLERTGIPLGVLEDAHWSQQSVEIKPGDALVLYTDGITDAQNSAEEFFGLDRLRESVRRHFGKSGRELHAVLFRELQNWVGDAPQFDDITLMVISRDKIANKDD